MRVAMETGSSGAILARELKSLGMDVIVVDAFKAHRVMEAISTAKTDKVDAKTLAELLAKGVLDTLAVWVPDQATHELRVISRTYEQLLRHSTQIRNEIRGIIRREGKRCSARELTSQGAQRWLDDFEAQLPPAIRVSLRVLRSMLAAITQELEVLRAELREIAAEHPLVQLLMTIPGCGALLGTAIAAEVGSVSRFPDSKRLRSYAGITPKVVQSGEQMRIGQIRKHGNSHLRRALVLLAQHISWSHELDDTTLKRSYYKVLRKHGPNPGKVHLARRLCDIIFVMLRDKATFDRERLAA
jgi:transposase